MKAHSTGVLVAGAGVAGLACAVALADRGMKRLGTRELVTWQCPAPGMERLRPPDRTRIARLHLAGGWTRTREPQSMEGAAKSGFLAAEAVLEDEGRPEEVSVPPAPRAGLERLVRLPGPWRRTRRWAASS